MTESTDILICGAGPVGATLALALLRDGRRVRLIDAAPEPVQGDDRSLGLTTGTVRLLNELGVWERVRGAEPIRSLHISERGRFGRSHIRASDHGLEHLGAVVPAQSLHDALSQALDASRIPVERGCRLRRMEMPEDDRVDTPVVDNASPVCYAQESAAAPPAHLPRRLCELTQPESSANVWARLVVGADGAQSSVRQHLGIDARVEDYGQIALVTQFETSRNVEGCAYERFDSRGPIAVMPRGSRRVGAIWMLPEVQAEERAAAGSDAFAGHFQEAFGWRLGRLTAAAPVLRWPLRRVRAERLIGPRALLIGNAAAAFHPVAAQSFNLAMRDAASLCEALRKTADPGDGALLSSWAISRQADHNSIERMTDGLVKIFGQRLPALAQLRSLGLLGLDLMEGLQGGLVARSAGVAPDTSPVAASPMGL